MDVAILWLLDQVSYKSTFVKNSFISQNLLLSVNKTPSAKNNDLPKMKHGVGNTGRYMLKCTNLSKDATRHFGMDSNHLVH